MIITESEQSHITDTIDTALRDLVDPADDRSGQNYWAVVGAASDAAKAVLNSAFETTLLKAKVTLPDGPPPSGPQPEQPMKPSSVITNPHCPWSVEVVGDDLVAHSTRATTDRPRAA